MFPKNPGSAENLIDFTKWPIYFHPINLLREINKLIGKNHGLDWPEWDNDVFIDVLNEELGTQLNDIARHKLLALKAALITNFAWQDFDVFENTCIAFANDIPLFGTYQPLDTDDMFFGIGVLDSIRDEDWSDEVKGYIAATCVYNGMVVYPEDAMPVKGVQLLIDKMLDPEIVNFSRKVISAWKAGERAVDGSELPIHVQLTNIENALEWFNLGNSLHTETPITEVQK